MAVYVIADIKVKHDAWIPEYASAVHDIVHKQGGRYLARSANVTTLEGSSLDNTLIAILQFPNAEAVKAFASDPAYAPYGRMRKEGSDSRFQLIEILTPPEPFPICARADSVSRRSAPWHTRPDRHCRRTG
jgi:uncharacterized protein (DUF1330 family)